MEDIETLHKYIQGDIPTHFTNSPGVEAYTLYMNSSKKLPKDSLISDLGTFQGLSALALSINTNIKVESYDIDLRPNKVSKRKNIKFIEANIFDYIDRILTSDLILIDLDPHDGVQEKRFFDILIENKYKGITLWDDIHINLGMQNFWDMVNIEKEDLTNVGHHSGTGYIKFE